MRTLLPVLVLLSSACWGAAAHAAEPVRPAERRAADSLYVAGCWPDAARAYSEISRREPMNAGARARLGVAYQMLGRTREAMAAYREALALGASPTAAYNLACCEARAGDREAALMHFELAVRQGYRGSAAAEADSDLASLRGEARFAAALESVKRAECPCKHAPESRQFDFWVGDWEVRDPQGRVAGSSSVQRILGDCVLLENWTASLGGSGKSFNIYNRSAERWEQDWVDDQGTVTHYRNGEYRDGRLTLVAQSALPSGVPALRRMTFFNLEPGRVRQLGEVSADSGKTWTTSFDLQYTRRN